MVLRGGCAHSAVPKLVEGSVGPAASVVGLGRDGYKGTREPEVAGSVWWEAAIVERPNQESSAAGRVGAAPRR